MSSSVYFHRQLTKPGSTGNTVILEDDTPPEGFIFQYTIVSARNSATGTSDVEVGVNDGSKFVAYQRSNNLPAGEFVQILDDLIQVKHFERLRLEWLNTVDADRLQVNLHGYVLRSINRT